jgi:hypothetical protein
MLWHTRKRVGASIAPTLSLILTSSPLPFRSISTAVTVLQGGVLFSPEDLEFDTFMVVGVKH